MTERKGCEHRRGGEQESERQQLALSLWRPVGALSTQIQQWQVVRGPLTHIHKFSIPLTIYDIRKQNWARDVVVNALFRWRSVFCLALDSLVKGSYWRSVSSNVYGLWVTGVKMCAVLTRGSTLLKHFLFFNAKIVLHSGSINTFCLITCSATSWQKQIFSACLELWHHHSKSDMSMWC